MTVTKGRGETEMNRDGEMWFRGRFVIGLKYVAFRILDRVVLTVFDLGSLKEGVKRKYTVIVRGDLVREF